MKFFPVYVFIILCACKHKKIHPENSTSKGISPIIVKDGSFFEIHLATRIINKENIYADLSITNNSIDSTLFYKALLPLNGELKTNIFSLFENESLEQIKYTGKKNEKCLKLAPDGDCNTIVPNLDSSNFIVLQPKQSKSYTINLSKFYDFSKVETNKVLSLTYANFLPTVSFGYKQIFEKDTVDGQLKPVYYNLTLPQKISIDSMRVQFKFIE